MPMMTKPFLQINVPPKKDFSPKKTGILYKSVRVTARIYNLLTPLHCICVVAAAFFSLLLYLCTLQKRVREICYIKIFYVDFMLMQI